LSSRNFFHERDFAAMTSNASPHEMPAYLAVAVEAFQSGDIDACFAVLRKAREAEPGNVKIVNNLGVVSGQAGRIDDAIGYFRAATELDPRSYEAWYNLGLLLRDKSQLPAARAAFERAVAVRPDAVLAITGLAFVCISLKDRDAARPLLEKAAERDPETPERWANLGNLLSEMRDFAPARDALERALRLAPNHIQTRYNLATLDYKVGDVEAASQAFDAIVAENDDEDAFPSLQRRYFPHISNAAFDGARLRAMGEAISAKFQRPPQPLFAPRPRGEKLRVGFLSTDFRRHSCAYFLKPLFENFDRSRYEFHCFADFTEFPADSISDWFATKASSWQVTTDTKMSAIAHAIAAAGIDVLFELGGYSSGSLIPVCAYKPALAIVEWLGFPGSTGVPEIGYRIGDAVADPLEMAARHFSEKIVRLPGPFLCFSTPTEAPDVAPSPIGIVGAPTFGSFNNPHKIRAPVAVAWTRIVTAVSGAKLLIKAPLTGEPKAGPRLRKMFAEAGMPPDRLIIADGQLSTSAYLGSYSRVDVALDTFPYNGTTTTCETLYMGVPVVAFAGARHSERVSSSLLHHAGLDELVADDVDDYVAKAIALGTDRARLADYRRTLRARLAESPVMDGAGWTRGFEAAVEEIYRDAIGRAAY
jgi:protein O-GlcNAc transferase